MKRRDFVRAAAFTAASYSRILGANDRLGMALIGTGRRGREVMRALLETRQVDLLGLCDIYDVQLERARQMLGKAQHESGKHEEILARPGVDAVLIATPDHWHLDIALDALKARKHVLLEKPAVHQHQEGAELYRAAKLSDRMVMVGTQQRSGPHYKRAKEEIFAQNKLGKILFVRTAWHDFGWQARQIPDEAKPANLDWVRFLGKTPYYEYKKARYDSWRYFPEYGGGILCDILNHWADVAVWMMNDTTPVDAVATGGIYHARDGRVNPDTTNAIIRYSTGWNLSFESTVWPLENPRPSVEFLGTEGTLDIARSDYVFKPKKAQPVHVKAEGPLELAQARNFVDACLKGAKLNSDVTTGLAGLLPCHMARAAYWTGKRVRYDAERNQIVTS
jgi:predicted dehydrogenase